MSTKRIATVFALLLSMLSLTGCGPSLMPLSEAIRLDNPTDKNPGEAEMYGAIREQARAGIPLTIRDFVVFFDDRNFELSDPICGLIDAQGNTYWFLAPELHYRSQAYGTDLINETEVNLYTCTVTPPSPGRYKFALRFYANERLYTGMNTAFTQATFEALP